MTIDGGAPSLAAFEGRWTLAREIEDRAAGASGHLTGEASFVARDDGLIYAERGRLRMGDGPELVAERRYLWRSTSDGIAVQFADGRPFHSFRPAAHAQGTDHPCGDDLYRVRYDFTAFPDWHSVWTVTGPRKDYTMTSRYTRAALAPSATLRQ